MSLEIECHLLHPLGCTVNPLVSLIKDQVDSLVKALKYQRVSLCKDSFANLESADKVPAICGDDTDRPIDIALQSPRHLETF